MPPQIPTSPPSRREFLKLATAVMGGGWLASNSALVMAAARQAQAALEDTGGFKYLSEAEAATLAALCDQIFPPDERTGGNPGASEPGASGPGASELGAVHFIDAALGGFMAGELAMIREGLADLDQRPGNSLRFHQLEFDPQTELVRQIEGTPMFGIVHFLTLLGLFAMPSYGGNANGAAWKMLGYEPRHHWQPPFGYYDARYVEENGHAGS